jgi:hypothetical protein
MGSIMTAAGQVNVGQKLGGMLLQSKQSEEGGAAWAFGPAGAASDCAQGFGQGFRGETVANPIYKAVCIALKVHLATNLHAQAGDYPISFPTISGLHPRLSATRRMNDPGVD